LRRTGVACREEEKDGRAAIVAPEITVFSKLRRESGDISGESVPKNGTRG
jgi:hypothetical protein